MKKGGIELIVTSWSSELREHSVSWAQRGVGEGGAPPPSLLVQPRVIEPDG